MSKFKPPITKLTGRMLKREADELSYYFWKHVEQTEVDQLRREYSEEAYRIMRAWADRTFPQSDLDTLERYNCVKYAEAVNINAIDEKTPLGCPKRYGIKFPHGKTIRIPCGYYWSNTIVDVSWDVVRLGPRSDYTAVIAQFKPFLDQIRDKQTELEQRRASLKEFAYSKPLRREFAAKYPEMARKIWPYALQRETEKEDA